MDQIKMQEDAEKQARIKKAVEDGILNTNRCLRRWTGGTKSNTIQSNLLIEVKGVLVNWIVRFLRAEYGSYIVSRAISRGGNIYVHISDDMQVAKVAYDNLTPHSFLGGAVDKVFKEIDYDKLRWTKQDTGYDYGHPDSASPVVSQSSVFDLSAIEAYSFTTK